MTRDASQAVTPVDVDVSERSREDHRVALPPVDASDRPRGRDPVEGSVLDAASLGTREELDQTRGHRYWSRARSAATVGRGEGLMQIHVHDVKAHIARAHRAQDGVQVRPVVVKEPTDVVDGFGDLGDLFFEEPNGVGIGQHDARDVGTEGRLQRL